MNRMLTRTADITLHRRWIFCPDRIEIRATFFFFLSKNTVKRKQGISGLHTAFLTYAPKGNFVKTSPNKEKSDRLL